MERSKRKTAGKRMGALVGKALEQDDAFWGHETWADDDAESGNESFHDSDEDSALKKDEFDSDFNDSETDNEEEEVEAGMEAERELKRTERSNQQKGNKGYKDIAGPGRAMLPKKGRWNKGAKRVMGDGVNAGIVLNFPPPGASSSSLSPAQGLLVTTGTLPVSPPIVRSASPIKKPDKPKITMASTRVRRSQQMLNRLRDNRSTAPTKKHKKTPRPAATKKAKRRQYGQDELLLEAIHDTEPENRRWLLARKRVQDIADQDNAALAGRDRAKGKVVQKYHSRRGCLNTLTFPEMDYVPDILTRSAGTKPPPQPVDTNCVITGKPAKYRDPRTKFGYHDVAAFKELRRREQAGEPLDQRPKKETIKEEPPTKSGTIQQNQQDASADVPSKKSSKKPTASKQKCQNGSFKTSAVKGQPSISSVSSTNKKPNDAVGFNGNQTPESTKSIVSITDPNLQVSPASPRRQSGRKWKPSTKLLQNIVHAGTGVLGNHLKPKPSDMALPELNGTDTSQDGKTPPPQARAAGKSSGSDAASKPRIIKPQEKKATTAAGEKPAAKRKTTRAKKPAPNGKAKSAPKRKKASNKVKIDPIVARAMKANLKKVYTIPEDKAAGTGTRKITHSQLIKDAIANYNKAKEASYKMTNNQEKKSNAKI